MLAVLLADTLNSGGGLITSTALTTPMSRPKREDASIKVAAAIVRMARFIAADRGIPIAEYLSELLAKPVKKDFDALKKKLAEEDE